MKKTMKAYINRKPEKGGLSLEQVPISQVESTEVLIKINAVSLNYRDLRMVEGTYTFNFFYDTILGADAAGEVIGVGEYVGNEWVGKKVIINPNVKWGENSDLPSDEFSILGSPFNGVFSEYVVVDISKIALQPEHLTDEEAACLPLSGITAYRALFTKAKVKKGDTLLVTGISGGVAQFIAQFSIAAGIKTYSTSSIDGNLTTAKNWGVVDGMNYRKTRIAAYFNAQNKKFDAIIDCAGGEQINDLLSVLKPMGRLVLYGAMNGKVKDFDLFTLYYNQLQVIGTLMGNDNEFTQMLTLVNNYKIKPKIDSVFKFEELPLALNKLKGRNHFGKIVLSFT